MMLIVGVVILFTIIDLIKKIKNVNRQKNQKNRKTMLFQFEKEEAHI